MPREISPHAATLLALIDNAAALAVIRNEYGLARDVVSSLEILCKNFGFEVESEIFEYILESIGSKPPQAMKKEFEKFAALILSIDKKLDKEMEPKEKKHEQFTLRD